VDRYTCVYMRSGRLWLWVMPAVAASMLAIACGDDPPTREIDQAQSAIDAARSAGADDYAHEEFAAADKALKSARDAVEQRDYRLALTNAIDSRERAQTAAKEAAEQKVVVRARVQRTLTDSSNALAQAHTRLKAAEGTRPSPRGAASARLAVQQADQRVQEARTAFEKGDFIGAGKALEAANTSLTEATRDLDSTAAGPAKRRR
jgi:hypothetical protein